MQVYSLIIIIILAISIGKAKDQEEVGLGIGSFFMLLPFFGRAFGWW